MIKQPTIRRIQPDDNPAVADIIRSVMTDFGAVGPGFSIEDPEVDMMFEAYQRQRSVYYVIESAGEVLGGGGIAPLDGGSADVCELKKMYYLPEARGQGIGKLLVQVLFQDAVRRHFSQMYLETLRTMSAANGLYQRLGFRAIDEALGNTGHCGCDTFYIKSLVEFAESGVHMEPG